MTEHEHTWEFGSHACITCGYVGQLAFEDVTEMEPIVGDPEYTAWLKAGRPPIEPNRGDTPTTTVDA